MQLFLRIIFFAAILPAALVCACKQPSEDDADSGASGPVVSLADNLGSFFSGGAATGVYENMVKGDGSSFNGNASWVLPRGAGAVGTATYSIPAGAGIRNFRYTFCIYSRDDEYFKSNIKFNTSSDGGATWKPVPFMFTGITASDYNGESDPKWTIYTAAQAGAANWGAEKVRVTIIQGGAGWEIMYGGGELLWSIP